MGRTFSASSFCFSDSDGIYNQQTDYSVAMWVNRAATTTNLAAFSEGSRSASAPFLVIGTGTTSGKLWIVGADNGGTQRVNINNNTITVFDGTWHHVVYGHSAAGAWQVYVDGVADATAHGTYTPGATTVNCLAVGGFRRGTTSSTFNGGSVAHVATWQRQLSATEAAALAGGLLPSVLGPVHYWPLWGVDATEPDIGSGHVGLSLSSGPTLATTNPCAGLSLLRV